jgi:molybdenum transport protein
MTSPVGFDVDAWLAEDAGFGDLTTEALGLAGRAGRIRFAARGGFVLAGADLAAAMFARAGLAPELIRRDGDRLADGETFLIAEGDAAALHLIWKSAQTLVEALSGIATAARAVVDAVESVDPDIRVACTRKTFPGGRRLSHLAVRAGGAILHRAGLSETVLVFAEHRAFLSDEPLDALARRLKRAAPEKKIGIEVDAVAEARAAIAAGFDIIQLEKFSPAAVAEVARFAAARPAPPIVAAAGGVNAGNAAEFVRAGATLIVTSAPYQAPPREVQVTLAPG